MIKLYTGYESFHNNTVEYRYKPTNTNIVLQGIIRFGFEIKQVIKEKSIESILVYIDHSEMDELYDNPDKFWNTYIVGEKTSIIDREMIMEREKEHHKFHGPNGVVYFK